MSSDSSQNENEYSHRQGSILTLPDEDDQATSVSDPSGQDSTQPQPFSSLNEHAQTLDPDDMRSVNIDKESQIATIDLQTVSDDNTLPSWKQSSEEILANNHDLSTSNSADDVTASFGFQQQDYEAIIRSKQLYFDPKPELIRKPQMIAPIVYKQNIMVKFLKPPSIPQGPLIIREIRPPQPPPPPPLVIRQRQLPPLSPPPIILREKPPRVPVIMTTQVLTKTLPPIPPPPRSVIIEKLPPLPPKPRDIIIERWIPYESTIHKRKIVIQRAQPPKPFPPPKNIIITYDKVEAQIVRQFRRLGVTPEDPQNYSSRYGSSLLDTKDLLAQAKELGITEDISLPDLINHELQEQSQQNFSHGYLFSQNKSSNSGSSASYTTAKGVYSDIDDNNYAPTYENLVNGSSTLKNYDELNGHSINHKNDGEDLSTQLAQYGLTIESIPH